MDEKSYKLPPFFQPFLATDALVGIAQAMRDKLDDGMPTKEPDLTDFMTELSGLIHANHILVKQLHAYLDAVDISGIRLPRDDKEFGKRFMIKEPPAAVYAVK